MKSAHYIHWHKWEQKSDWRVNLHRFLLTSRTMYGNSESCESGALFKRDETIALALKMHYWRCLARGRRVLEMAPWMLRDYHIHYPGRKCDSEILRKERMANPFSRGWSSPSFVYCDSSPGIGHWRMGSWELAHLLDKTASLQLSRIEDVDWKSRLSFAV